MGKLKSAYTEAGIYLQIKYAVDNVLLINISEMNPIAQGIQKHYLLLKLLMSSTLLNFLLIKSIKTCLTSSLVPVLIVSEMVYLKHANVLVLLKWSKLDCLFLLAPKLKLPLAW